MTTTRIIAVLTIAVLALSGCGGDSDGSSSDSGGDDRAAECGQAFEKFTADFKDAYAEGELEKDKQAFVDECVAHPDQTPEEVFNGAREGDEPTEALSPPADRHTDHELIDALRGKPTGGGYVEVRRGRSTAST